MQENKKKMISLSITVITLLFIVVGATYAYFQAQIDTGKSTDVDITAESVDSLTFTTGDSISFKITQDNFSEGGSNLSGSTTATASLIAGKNRTATYNYNIYLNIGTNNFKYTTSDNTPELLLKVTGPDGVVTSIDGLTYNTTLGGFDITTKTGKLKIVSNKEISTTTSKEDNWTIEIIFRNLNSDQSANAGKMVRAEVKIEKEESGFTPTIADVCHEGDNLANCIKVYADSNTYEVTKIIKHDGSDEYDANDGSYRYTGPDGSSELDTTIFGSIKSAGDFNFYYYLSDFEPAYINQIVAIMKKSDAGEKLTAEEAEVLDDFYAKAYDGTYLWFESVEEAMASATHRGLADNVVKNYICFGSDAEVCPNDDLYRIIGVFGDQVKLIKADYATTDQLGIDGDYKKIHISDEYSYKGIIEVNNLGSYMYNYNGLPDKTVNNGNGLTDWETSLLNKTNLNTNYITYLNTRSPKWLKMIADTKWNLGGHTTLAATAKTFYEAEKIKQTSEATKIGLMYPSDYGYGTLSSDWSQNISGGMIKGSNWMHMGISEWTISSNSVAFFIESYGFLSTSAAKYDFSIRPVFYLNANVNYMSGSGTFSNPFRINQ